MINRRKVGSENVYFDIQTELKILASKESADYSEIETRIENIAFVLRDLFKHVEKLEQSPGQKKTESISRLVAAKLGFLKAHKVRKLEKVAERDLQIAISYLKRKQEKRKLAKVIKLELAEQYNISLKSIEAIIKKNRDWAEGFAEMKKEP